jgi:hypothetical protein
MKTREDNYRGSSGVRCDIRYLVVPQIVQIKEAGAPDSGR